MILHREITKELGERVKSYCDLCKRIYWSNPELAVTDVEIETSCYSYFVSVCPACINKYDLELAFAAENDDLEALLEKREKKNKLK